MSHEHDHETKISLLQQESQEVRRLLNALTTSQAQQTIAIHAMDKKLDIAIALVDPTLAKRVTSLEISRAETVGGRAMLAALVAGAASVGGLVSWLLSLVWNRPHSP